MNVLVYLVGCVLLNVAAAEDTYRAAVARDVGRNSDLNAYIPAIHEAGRKDVDIVVLPFSDTLNSEYNYDEGVKNIAKAARVSRVYVAALLREGRARLRSAVVLDREGAVVSVHRKSATSAVNYTASEEFNTFSTDFGVEFTMLMEEDLALQDPALMKTRNLIVTGSWPVQIPFLTVGPLSAAWSFVSKANVVSSAGIHGGAAFTTERLLIADVDKSGRNGVLSPPVVTTGVVAEDLSQYIIRPLDVEASATGYTETVCHHKFCCQFYIKASIKGSTSSSMNFGLAAYDGVRHFASDKYIGTQTCALFSCAGLYKRSCDLGARNNTDLVFQEVSVSANFTPNSVQFPMIVSSDVINTSQYSMDVINKQTTAKVRDASVTTFGIFGRDFSKDREAVVEEQFVDAEGLFNENVQEFIDYVWIRLRILIFVVSIYILEMM